MQNICNSKEEHTIQKGYFPEQSTQFYSGSHKYSLTAIKAKTSAISQHSKHYQLHVKSLKLLSLKE